MTRNNRRVPKDAPALIRMHQEAHPKSHFFDPGTLRFFGETISSMRLLKTLATVKTWSGGRVECYVLSARQRRPDGKTVRVYHYFDTNTLADVVPVD